MIASFERYLRRKTKYHASIISDFSISEKSHDAAVQARTAQTQLRGGNKEKGSVCLREIQRQVLYNKGLLKKSSPEALLNSLWLIVSTSVSEEFKNIIICAGKM